MNIGRVRHGPAGEHKCHQRKTALSLCHTEFIHIRCKLLPPFYVVGTSLLLLNTFHWHLQKY